MGTSGEPTFSDLLEQGERLDSALVEFLEKLEGAGWWPSVRRARGFRYHCPCTAQHNVWIDSRAFAPERMEFYFRRTCLPLYPSNHPT